MTEVTEQSDELFEIMLSPREILEVIKTPLFSEIETKSTSPILVIQEDC
jgi:hypothetical protein